MFSLGAPEIKTTNKKAETIHVIHSERRRLLVPGI